MEILSVLEIPRFSPHDTSSSGNLCNFDNFQTIVERRGTDRLTIRP